MNTRINTNRESQIGNSRNNYGFIRKLFGSVNLGYSDIVIGNHAEVRFLLFGKYHTLSGRQLFFSTCGERDGERGKGRSGKGGRGRGQEAGGEHQHAGVRPRVGFGGRGDRGHPHRPKVHPWAPTAVPAESEGEPAARSPVSLTSS